MHLFAGQCRSPANGLANTNCDVNGYMWSGFLQLQSAIDTALLRVSAVSIQNFINVHISARDRTST